MEAKNADLSALRIDRAADPVASAPGARRWLVIGLPVAGVVVLAAVLLATSGALGSAVPVRLTPATMVSPMRSGSVLMASGYVVAQRKAAVASKGTGRLVYLGVLEGDRVRAGQVIARIEDADIKAQLAQAEANVQVSRAELHDAQRSLARERLLNDSGASSQASVDAAEARYERVKASIAAAEAAVVAAQVALENTVIRAPFDGTVLTKNADVGEVVAPLDANPDVRYPGSVAMIVPTADRAKATVQVKVAFRSYDARVLPEMSAKVHFLPRPSRAAVDTQPVLVVPSAAVAERNGRSVVFVVERGRAVEVAVVVGRQVGSSVAIREGLHPGVQVVDSVGARLRGGAKVTVQ